MTGEAAHPLANGSPGQRLPFARRRGQGAVYAPPALQSLRDRAVPQSDFTGPHRHGLRHAIERYQATRSFVVSLFLQCSPSYIPRLIVAIHVNPVDGVRGRGLAPHVSKELLVTIAPCIRKANAPTAVVGEVCVVGIEAALLHLMPRHVFRRNRSVSRISVMRTLRAEVSPRRPPAGDAAKLPLPHTGGTDREWFAALGANEGGGILSRHGKQPSCVTAGVLRTLPATSIAHTPFYHFACPDTRIGVA